LSTFEKLTNLSFNLSAFTFPLSPQKRYFCTFIKNMSIALSEQEILRRESLQQLRALGINPYPAEEYKVTAFAQDINRLPWPAAS
jgi:hypothetical protein